MKQHLLVFPVNNFVCPVEVMIWCVCLVFFSAFMCTMMQKAKLMPSSPSWFDILFHLTGDNNDKWIFIWEKRQTDKVKKMKYRFQTVLNCQTKMLFTLLQRCFVLAVPEKIRFDQFSFFTSLSQLRAAQFRCAAIAYAHTQTSAMQVLQHVWIVFNAEFELTISTFCSLLIPS